MILVDRLESLMWRDWSGQGKSLYQAECIGVDPNLYNQRLVGFLDRKPKDFPGKDVNLNL
jgi:hypothetical protein